MTLSSTHVFTLTIDLAETVDVGAVPLGHRRVIPIAGGEIDGPELRGEILPGGADWNTISADGTVHVWARYEFRTEDGAIVGVINEGTHSLAGEDVGLAGVAIITRPTFTAAAGAPDWLNRDTFAGILRPVGPARVSVEVHRLEASAQSTR